MNLVRGDASFAKAAESSAEVTALDGAGGCGCLVQLEREAAALAVVGLGEVDELEVKAKGAGELIGGGKVEGMDAGERMLEVGGGLVGRSGLPCFGLAARDGGAAESLDGFVEWVAGLLAENVAEEHAERTDVAAKGSLFELASGGLELGEALGPVGWGPQGRHLLIMP